MTYVYFHFKVYVQVLISLLAKVLKYINHTLIIRSHFYVLELHFFSINIPLSTSGRTFISTVAKAVILQTILNHVTDIVHILSLTITR